MVRDRIGERIGERMLDLVLIGERIGERNDVQCMKLVSDFKSDLTDWSIKDATHLIL